MNNLPVTLLSLFLLSCEIFYHVYIYDIKNRLLFLKADKEGNFTKFLSLVSRFI